MILIEEKPAKHLPCLTSLFFTLPYFNKTIVDTLLQQDVHYYDKKTSENEFPITKLYFLVNLLKSYDDVEFIPYIKKEKKLVPVETSDFKVEPYSYQLEGITYGANNEGWMLLDDQGLGKTLQMIYLAQTLKEKENLEHCLIICGVNGLKYNWANEIEKMSDLSYTILGKQVSKKGRVSFCSLEDRCKLLKNKIDEFFVITNLETLQAKEFYNAFKKSKNKFDMIVLDEAHKCKNSKSKSGSVLLKLKSKRCIALTGTILTNKPENAYVPLKWIGKINCTENMFNNMYNVYGGVNNAQILGHKNLNLLQELIASCSLRRLKSEVLKELPEKTFSIEYVEMDSRQEKLYNDVSVGITEELDKLKGKKKLTILQELVMHMRQRQVTAWPGILSSSDVPSAKLDRLDDLLENITAQNDKVIVYFTFKQMLPELVRRFSKYNPVFCVGGQKDVEIEDAKNKFNTDSNVKVMFCTWQKMGTGFTLTAANYAIFIDTPWNDSDFKQACDRIHRIGQQKNVFIITLITKYTYDERVQEILTRKERVSDYVLDGKDSEDLIMLQDYI